MNIDLKNNKKARYIFNTVGLLICLGMLFYIYREFINPAPIKMDAPANVQQNDASEKKPASTKKAEGTTQTVSMAGNVSQNPFIDLTELRAKTSGTISSSVNNAAVSINSGNNGLPQIPSGYPAPNVGSIPLPAIPGNNGAPAAMAVTQSPQTGQSSVKGVFTGANGNNMAIMSDGKIVSTGDTYQDGRIAYIGGDGIQFDDGHAISYK